VSSLYRKARQLECLKTIASRGGLTAFVHITTADLGEMLGISQQSASRWMSDLIERKLLERRFISGRPHVALTETGESVLREDYALLRSLLGEEPERAMPLRGRLSGGFGEGGYYIGQQGYLRQIDDKFSFVPFRGTFNIVVFPEFMADFRRISVFHAVLLNGFDAGGRSFGEVRCFSGKIRSLACGEGESEKSVSCVILQPRRTHHSDTLEILAPMSLREFFRAADGHEFEVTVYPHEQETPGSNDPAGKGKNTGEARS